MSFSLSSLGKYKYILLLALCALALLLLAPSSGGGSSGVASETEARLEYVLSRIEGAGNVDALCTENGAAVVCDGADNAQVRLAIVRAVSDCTGLGSDKITVLKRAE